MSRCLRPGRILPFGRRPTASRLPFIPYRSVSPFSRPTWTQYTRKTRNDQREINFPDEVLFLRRYNLIKHPHLRHDQKRHIEEWMPVLRDCIPPKTTKPPDVAQPAGQPRRLRPLRESEHELDRTHALLGCLWDGRIHFEFQLIAHLGFAHHEWSNVQALLNSLIDTYELLAAHMPPKHPSAGLDWNRPYRVRRRDESTSDLVSPITSKVSLSKLTGGTKSSSPWKWSRLEPLPSDNISLDTLTVEPAPRFFGERILAEVLANLGSLVLYATRSRSDDSKHAMSCVYRTLARLHHAGMISDRVYQYPKPDASQIVFRPPGLHFLSGPIMSVLSDAAWHEHEVAVAAAAADAGKLSPFVPYTPGIRELGPEIWLELILWCCVEHGFCRTGTLLVHQMTRLIEWKAESWAPLINDLATVQKTNVSIEQSWRRPGQNEKPPILKGQDKEPFNGLGFRTISSEVVASLRSGLANKAYVGMGDRGYLPEDLTNLSAPLTKLIDPALSTREELRPTNRFTNWHIVRILASGCLKPSSDPVAFEDLLRSQNNVVPPWEGNELSLAQVLDGKTRAQFYDESAAMTGLIEFNLNYYARDKQSGRLFHEYAWLQNISDASKAQHIQRFFERVSQASDEEASLLFDFKSFEPHDISQSSIPQLSCPTFANLLDVATTTHAFDFGQQLLLENDIDGPAIPQRAYGNQALAPSILRFAAATANVELGERVIASLAIPLSVNTIKSLINFSITRKDWKRVVLMLNFLTEHRAKSWGYVNIGVLASAIIRLDATVKHRTSAGTLTPADTEDLNQATDILLRIFRGEWHANTTREKVRNFQLRTLSRMHRVLSLIPGPLPDILKQVEPPKEITGHHKATLIPPATFHEIFAAVVETQGAIVGKQLWDKVCVDWVSPKRQLQSPGGVARLLFSDERANAHGSPGWDADYVNHVRSKATIADLNTVRILARSAVREYAECVKQATDEQPHGRPSKSKTKTDPNNTTSSSPSSSSFIYDRAASYTPSISRKEYPYQLKSGKMPQTELESILDFCLETFLKFGLPEDQVDIEIPGHMRRMQLRKVFSSPTRRPVRMRIKYNRSDPFMRSHWPKELAESLPPAEEPEPKWPYDNPNI
ncbi:hypothetical protein DTO013E5_795 [Penicillium roqueforti]|uniref:Genomic scaffold, ProqFM164S01 n=1 Tax=Penicillium roqueforti (strain FM164) TaxID=1365484 RepID=W6QGR4_PENRF|nr:hypothetical protein DTO012A1_151 [Penicillium roqueforti]CDM28787.1 unnamed protein product [Penicillium roqueforti FM164]KAI2750921.1 hypothetical protein DTO013F2_4172 [Penicillium roqueforti]KAI2774983.1 hypothetical protein DTO012A8_468 [Penicillium roqueforti]KAI3083615.1 hypothetical protein CBS147339_1991 [Penicillium roqueforti]